MTTKPKRKRRPAAGRSLGRLERILLLVPYCVRHQGVTLNELAKVLGATPKEIAEDLELLFMCGLPDYTPADLIEVSLEEDRVSIRMADYFDRPLRLTRTEAIPLYLKGNALLDLLRESGESGPRVAELAPLRSALDKLGQALLPQEGGVAELTKRIKVHLEEGEAQWLPVLREAVTANRRVEMEYYTVSRDALTRRQVDPYKVFATLGHWYTSGYCHLAQDRRMFRLDRVKSLELLDEAFEPPSPEASEIPPPLLYEPGPSDVRVVLRVSGQVAVWLSESGFFFPALPIESTRNLRGGRKELAFRTSSFPWLEKLLLRFGGDIEVIEPTELRDGLRGAARKILSLYQPPAKRKRTAVRPKR